MAQKNEIAPICPHCQSDNVSKSKKPASVVGFLILLIGLPIVAYKTEYHCFDCYEDFKLEEG